MLATSVINLLYWMMAATVSHTLGPMIETLGRTDLLVVDESGYMPVDAQRSNFFLHMVLRRYEKGSIILTASKPLDRWGEVFGDDVIASAILDRLLHYCHIIPTSGPSYCIEDKWEELKKGVEPMLNI